MRDHELELIAALVEGRLEDEAEARALIASSPAHAKEFEAQSLAYTALRGVDAVSMSDTERAALHRDVWTTLRSEPAPEKRAPWWYRWTPVAAGLLVIAGSVAVLNQNLGGEDEAQTFAEISGEMDRGLATDTTAAASDGVTSGDDGSGGGDGASVTTFAAEGGDVEESPSPQPAAAYSSRASDVRQGDYDAAGALAFDDDEPVDPELQACVGDAIEDAGLQGYEILAFLEGMPEPITDTTSETTTTLSMITAELAVATTNTADPSTAPLAFVDLADCVVVYLDE